MYSSLKPTAERGGRVGLDAECDEERGRLRLPQTHSHAFISVGPNDAISLWGDTQFKDITITQAVVGPTGIKIASSLELLIQGKSEQSFACARAVPDQTVFWLAGTSKEGLTTNMVTYRYGQFAKDDDSCRGWTFGMQDPITRARPGSAQYVGQRMLFAPLATQEGTLFISCGGTATRPVMCLAYTP
jgi:hypothetical protein